MQIKDIRGDGYYFGSIKGDHEAQIKQINNLKYVEHLGQVTKTDVSDWPLDVFMTTEGRIYSERQKLNEVFFEFKAKADAMPKAVPNVNMAAVKQIEKSMITMLDQKIEREGLKMTTAMKELDLATKKAVVKQRDVFYHSTLVRSLQKVRDDGFNLLPQIQTVLDCGFWQLVEDSNALQFISPPITITYFNKKQARNNAVHLGKLLLTLSVSTDCVLSAKCSKHSGAAHTLDNAHPHVNGSGQICFGELKPHYERAIAIMDIPGVCELVRQILNSYNEGDAYVNIHTFEDHLLATHAEPEEEEDDSDEDWPETEPDEEDPEEHEDVEF